MNPVFAEFVRGFPEGLRLDEFFPEPEAFGCEACCWHPLTEEHCQTLHRLGRQLKLAGLPGPCYFWVHCNNELNIVWVSEDRTRRAWLDNRNDVLLSTPEGPTHVNFESGDRVQDH